MLNQIVTTNAVPPKSAGPFVITHTTNSSGDATANPVLFQGDSSIPQPIQPLVTIPRANAPHGLGVGTQLVVRARARVDLNACHFASGANLILELCSVQGGVATEIAGSDTTFAIPASSTASTGTLAVIDLPPVKTGKLSGTEVIALYATLSAAPTAGNIEVVEASIEVDLA